MNKRHRQHAQSPHLQHTAFDVLIVQRCGAAKVEQFLHHFSRMPRMYPIIPGARCEERWRAGGCTADNQ